MNSAGQQAKKQYSISLNITAMLWSYLKRHWHFAYSGQRENFCVKAPTSHNSLIPTSYGLPCSYFGYRSQQKYLVLQAMGETCELLLSVH